MASVALPALPWQADVKPRLMRFGTDLTPALGGPVSRINRLGARYAVDVTLPTLDQTQGPLWVAAQLQADAENATVSMTWPAPEYESITTAEVDGGGQAGTNLLIRGLVAGTVIPAGIPVSFWYVRHYLHMITASVVAASDGTATLQLSPMMRIQPANGTVLNFAAPTIEGFLQGGTIPWEVQLQRFHKISFTLAENA